MSPQLIAIIRGLIAVLAALFQTNTIPTGVDGGGERVAAALYALALMIPAGDKTPQLMRDAADKINGLTPPTP